MATQTLVAYGATWTYKVGAFGHSSGFQAVAFDDSSWDVGAAIFGTTGTCGHVATTAWAVATDLCVRIEVDVPATATAITLTYGIDNNASVYWNGTLLESVVHSGCATNTDQTVDVGTFNVGINVLAVRCTDGGDSSYFDLTAVATVPEATPGVWLDADRDGFNDAASDDVGAPLARMLPEGSSSTSDNITDDVIDFHVRQPGDKEHSGGSFPASCTITVKNADGKYSPDNTSSSLYGKPVIGAPLWIGANADGTLSGTGQTVHGVFAGYVREVVPLPVPKPGTGTPTASIICDDPLTEYAERNARVTFSETRTVKSYREAILTAIGESADRLDLADENDPLPITGNVGGRSTHVSSRVVERAALQRVRVTPLNALKLLEDLNQVTGSRHYVQPADTKEDFYDYKTVLRTHKLTAAADGTWNGDDFRVSGYKSSVDGVVNVQRAQLNTVSVDATPVTVWSLSEPVAMDAGSFKEIIATFGDYVFGAAAQYSVTGSVSVAMASYGDGAVIRFDATGAGVVNSLFITGRRVDRSDTIEVERTSPSSRNTYRERQGRQISSDYLQSSGLAEGIVNFHLWKFSQPLKQPQAQVTNQPSTTLPRELYDVISLTVDQLHVADKRFEIVGREVRCSRAANATVQNWQWDFDIQQTPNAAALSLFTIGTSTFGGSDGLAP